MCAGRSTSAIPEIEVIVSTTLRPFLMVLAFWWWLVVFPWCVGVGDGMCCDVACEVMWLAERWDAIWCNNLTWGEVMWLVARCDVMSPNLAAVTKKWRSNIPSIAPATKNGTPSSPIFVSNMIRPMIRTNGHLAPAANTPTPNAAPATKSDRATSPNDMPHAKKVRCEW